MLAVMLLHRQALLHYGDPTVWRGGPRYTSDDAADLCYGHHRSAPRSVRQPLARASDRAFHCSGLRRETVRLSDRRAGLTAAAAAETLRAGDIDGAIALIGAEPYLPYYRPRLPGLVAGHVGRATVLERSDRWATRLRVDTLLGQSAVALDTAARSLALADGGRIGYRKLLIATGARPRTLGVPGEDLLGVHRLWKLADAERIIADLPAAGRAITVGGGFIGAELTEAFLARGLAVTYLVRGPRWFAPYVDEVAGRMVEDELRLNGVDVRFNSEVARVIERNGHVAAVETLAGERLEADIVTCSLGASFDLGWLVGSGLALGRGVLVNEWLETNLPDVWAAGDVADVWHPRVGARVKLHNTASAGVQGRMAALGMLGRRTQLLKTPQYGFRLFGLFFVFVGVKNSEAPGLDSWTLADPSERAYLRAFIHDGRFVGGLAVNSRHAGMLRRLVDQHAPVPADPGTLFGAGER